MGVISGLFSNSTSAFNKANSGNSTTTNETNTIAQEMMTGDKSVGASASGNGIVNVHTSDMGAIDSAMYFANAAGDSAFKFADSAMQSNALVTDGALSFAGHASDGAYKLVNATVDSAFKGIADATAANSAAMAAASANAMHLANASTDSALRFGDSALANSFDFARALTMGAAHDVAAAGMRADDMTKTALASVKDAYADTSATLADAYTNSKAGEQKVMVAAALAIVGLVAAKIFGK